MTNRPPARLKFSGLFVIILKDLVGLAQMVRASDCGPEGRRFDPDIPPHKEPSKRESLLSHLRGDDVGKTCEARLPQSKVICECSTAVSMQVFQT